MALHLRNPEADRLARELARIDRTSITDAVIVALRETVRNRGRNKICSLRHVKTERKGP
ncbi:type II toxin-antitoxin system VapB family antitoxin [Brucella anthropi]|uniref:type II toxin-antitoxin system VapB family antitoxin n=1 Tax=Brucella anthropi TaxID=529 RepID=UPI003C7B73E9